MSVLLVPCVLIEHCNADIFIQTFLYPLYIFFFFLIKNVKVYMYMLKNESKLRSFQCSSVQD